jgi:RNA polymerase sigma-54 factor
MTMNVAIQLRARQQLAMTPELQHSIWLLQLSGVEFEQAVEEALSTNPFLERDENEAAEQKADDAPAALGEGVNAAPAPDAAPEPAPDEAIAQRPEEWESGEWMRSAQPRDEGDDADIGGFSPAPVALRDHLLAQVGASRLGDRDRELATLLVNALDGDGYLRQSFDDLRSLVAPAAEDDELAVALKWVQSLEPAGVGTRSTVECLQLQLEQLPSDTPGLALARRMLTEQLDATAAHDTTRLKKLFDCDECALREAYTAIRRCNPRPGSAFGVDDTRYVVADVIARKQGKRWIATINPQVVPRIQLNHIYADILQKQRGASGTPLGQQLQEARWFVRNVQQRFQTIQRVAQAIVDRQSRYLDYGDVAMKPLVLRDIAQELGLHESTVSRVTSNKYMATPRGLIELKYFFGSQVDAEGAACSSTAMRALIRQIIAAEERTNPLSDIKVTKLLSSKGVRVARRTVSKYRDAMQIPPVEARRMTATA